jgi:hypothetical protein
MNDKLKYFGSIEVPVEMSKTFTQLEDILQREHRVDGSHPMATESQSGFITPDLVRKINQMWENFKKQ